MPKIILAVLVLGIIGIFIFFSYNSGKQKIESARPSFGSRDSSVVSLPQNDDNPSLKLKSIGIEFSDFKFTKEKLQFNRLFMDYGFFIPASSASPDKKNPQPTFILPLGTKVQSLVDGIVVDIPTVWSGDFSVMVGTGDDKSPWRYETEHVKNVLIQVGDKVSAG